jgi:hypothetical protein
MTEFSICMLFCVGLVAGAAGLFQHEWNRARCAYLVFEATHARLVGRDFGTREVNLLEDSVSVRGEAICGNAHEAVELPRLDPAP